MTRRSIVPAVAAALLSICIAGSSEAAEPEDHHAIPWEVEEAVAGLELTPGPAEYGGAEYPLAIAFNPADTSNYSANGIVSFDYVVVHTVQGSYLGCQSWFQNPSANVSAHFVVQSEDGEVTQMVELADRAWHVGSSNAYAIGIEHEGYVDDPAWYTFEMYRGSSLLARWIADELGIPRDREHVVGHGELPAQTHTDPGDNWNWDLYMALINDWVDEGTIEGHVVDRGSLCTITASADTWIKKTPEDSAELGDADKCFVAGGTELTYLHASGELVGHKRVTYDAAGGPCEGMEDLDGEGLLFAGHWSEPCSDASKAAAGVTVVLDGEQEAVTDADGHFAFTGVAEGAHGLEVLGGEDYEGTDEVVDLAVFPGARAVLAVDPLGGEEGGTGPSDGGIGTSGGTAGGGDELGEGDESGDFGTIDYLDADSCACDGGEERTRPGLGFALFALLCGASRRRRSRE